MKTKLISAVVCLIAVCASAQLRRRPPEPKPLEPLLQFAEVVKKAKNGVLQGYYALVVPYAKEEEMEHDA